MSDALLIRHLEEITPAWLTAVLQHAGLLAGQRVSLLSFRTSDAYNSRIAHLQVSYTPSASKELPDTWLVKLNQGEDGKIEVEFYSQNMHFSRQQLPMIVPCSYAAYDAQSGASCLLLQDFTATHQPPVTRQDLLGGRGVPARPVMEAMIDALSAFHAFWWESPCCGEAAHLTSVRPWFASAAQHASHVERRSSELHYFQAAAGPSLPKNWLLELEFALQHLPTLWLDYLRPRVSHYAHMTLSHGDCYLTQFLVPRNAKGEPVLLVDFDSASGNFPAFDLVYLMGTFWTRNQRLGQDLEILLLRRYYEGLITRNVIGYTWEDLQLDYRLMLAYMLFDPVADMVRGSPSSYWQPKLSCLLEAYQDWRCREL